MLQCAGLSLFLSNLLELLHLWLCLAPRSMGQQTTDGWRRLRETARSRRSAPWWSSFFCSFFSLCFFFLLYCCFACSLLFFLWFYFPSENREGDLASVSRTLGKWLLLWASSSRGALLLFQPPVFLSVYILSLRVFSFLSFRDDWSWEEVETLEMLLREEKKESFVFFPLKLNSSKSKSLSVYRGEKKTTRRPRKFQRPQRPDKCLFSFVFSFFLSSSVSFLVFPVLSDQVKCLYTTPVSLYTHKHMYARFFSIYLINNRCETSWGTASSSNRRVVNVEQGYMFQPVD